MTITGLEVTITAPVVSFRNPLYAGVQVGLPCPPPSTVGGLLAAARGGWPQVHPATRFAMTFESRGDGIDLETYHPLDAAGKATSPTPRDRDFLADVTLTIWLVDDIAIWQAAMRRPVWPLRLGRSQDLVEVRVRSVPLEPGTGRQGHALLPGDRTSAGMLLQLPIAVSLDRSRTRWNTFRYARSGADERVDNGDGSWVDPNGQAVVLLASCHPEHAWSQP